MKFLNLTVDHVNEVVWGAQLTIRVRLRFRFSLLLSLRKPQDRVLAKYYDMDNCMDRLQEQNKPIKSSYYGLGYDSLLNQSCSTYRMSTGYFIGNVLRAYPELTLNRLNRHAEIFVDRSWYWDPAWRTPLTIVIARNIYDSWAWEEMPVLADALEDVGCDEVPLLTKLRDPNREWYRGCCILDILTGRD